MKNVVVTADTGAAMGAAVVFIAVAAVFGMGDGGGGCMDGGTTFITG